MAGDPWLITVDDDGNMTEYDDFDDQSVGIALALVANHANHGGIFFVPECASCVEAHGSA